MAMMAYRATIFCVFFNYAMLIARYISGFIFPGDVKSLPGTADIIALKGIENFASFDTVSGLLLTAGVLALFAFSLLIPTIPFIFMLFGLSGIIMDAYIWQLPLPDVFKFPIIMGITIIHFVGISQYAARSSLQGS